jgi:ATP-dependent DNA helicase PIF1
MMNVIIETTILNVKFKGEDVLLPRIPIILTDMSFEFKRLQFPVRLAFAMIINIATSVWTKFGKSMLLAWTTGCSLLCSRVGKPSDLFVYTPEGKTKNIIYSKALQ